MKSIPNANPSPKGDKGTRGRWQAFMHIPWGEPCIVPVEQHAMDMRACSTDMDMFVVGRCPHKFVPAPSVSMRITVPANGALFPDPPPLSFRGLY